MSKNILHLMGMNSTKYGGLERYNVELANQLREKGYHSVFVYEEYPHVQQFADDLCATGAELIVINSRKNIWPFCTKIWKLYKKYNFCTIHAHFTKARFYALPLAVLYGIQNRLYTIHSTIVPLDKLKLHTRLWYWWMNRRCRVVAVSKQIEQVVKNNWPNAIVENIYLGIEPIRGYKTTARKDLHIDLNKIVVMTIANFNCIKGLDVLCQAVKILADANQLVDVEMYIVGQPKNEIEELQIQIRRLGIEPYIHMEGIKNNISTYLYASDFYVQPSRYEGLPLALMEATSVGLPIIASNIGGIPEVAQQDRNALLFTSEDSQMLANCITQLINNEKLCARYGSESKSVYFESFCVKENVSKLITYYNL